MGFQKLDTHYQQNQYLLLIYINSAIQSLILGT
jgi:hypothetical protein